MGHRRWLLYPQTQQMGTGDVAGDGTHPAANALWIEDSHLFDPRPAVRDTIVAWPPPGYTPYMLAFPRWSLSYPNVDFSSATVSMSRNGVNVPVTLEAVAVGFGENTLVWRPSDPLLTNPAPLASADATFSVTIQNALLNGQPQSATYFVTLFNPTLYGPDTVLPKIVGSGQPTVGQNNAYTIAGAVPMADGYDWFYAMASAYSAVLGAENGLAGMTASTSPGYAPITSETAAAGTSSYHLMHTQVQDQTLTLNGPLVPGTQGALNFYSRLGWAGSTETAAVQISLDGGNNWQDIYTQQGTGTQGEQSFTLRTVSLSRFAGRPITLRFNFKQPTGQYYTSGPGVGWYMDNVAFNGTTGLGVPTAISATAGGAFTFNPPASGQFALAARGTIQTHPLEWGNVTLVSAGTSPTTECLFNWAEKNYPTLFSPAGSPTSALSVYTYRYYSATNAYLGVSSLNNHLYYLGAANNGLLDAGPLSYWLPLAGCN